MSEQKKVHIFVSYSHKDRSSCDELMEHLGWLRNSGIVKYFDDKQIKPSEKWDTRIEAELSRADIVIFLISSSFIGSKYCTINEMLPLIERGVKKIPVLIRPADFEALPLSEYSALPLDRNKNLKPISAWKGPSGRDEAWTQVAIAIRALVKDLDGPIPLDEHSEIHFKSHSKKIKDEKLLKIQEIIGSSKLEVQMADDFQRSPLIIAEIQRTLVPYRERMMDFKPDEFAVSGGMVEAEFLTNVVNLRCVSISSYVRSFFGGAHSSYEYLTVNLDINSKKIIKIEDIIKKENIPDLITCIFEKAINAKRNRTHQQTDGQELEKFNFQLSRTPFIFYSNSSDKGIIDGLRFLFSPYEIGSFAEGSYEIDIKLSDMLSWSTEYFEMLIASPNDSVVGSYSRIDFNAQASFTVLPASRHGEYRVRGIAYWGTRRETGPNIGELDVIAKWEDGILKHEKKDALGLYILKLRFTPSQAHIEEVCDYAAYGMNVTFEGSYQKD